MEGENTSVSQYSISYEVYFSKDETEIIALIDSKANNFVGMMLPILKEEMSLFSLLENQPLPIEIQDMLKECMGYLQVEMREKILITKYRAWIADKIRSAYI